MRPAPSGPSAVTTRPSATCTSAAWTGTRSSTRPAPGPAEVSSRWSECLRALLGGCRAPGNLTDSDGSRRSVFPRIRQDPEEGHDGLQLVHQRLDLFVVQRKHGISPPTSAEPVHRAHPGGGATLESLTFLY